MLLPEESVEIYVNQNTREGYVLAVVKDEALIEYEMPNGTTALRIVPRDNPDAYPYKRANYLTLSAKWIKAMSNQGTLIHMIANPQRGGRDWLKHRGFYSRIEKVIEK
jgi:hypothetical protein